MRHALAISFCLLAGCTANDTRYPLLAPRPTEKIGFEEPVRSAVGTVADDPALDYKLAALRNELDRLTAGFADASDKSGNAANAARGAPAGSEAWLTAQTSLAGLDDLHAHTSSLASDVEQLAIDRAAMLAPLYPKLTALIERVRTEDKEQGETIARFARMLAPA